MISGHDLILLTSLPLSHFLRIIQKHWPGCIIQNALTCEIYSTIDSIPGDCQEIMVYIDQRMFEYLDLIDNYNQFIHLLKYSPDQITLVADDWNAEELKEMLADI